MASVNGKLPGLVGQNRIVECKVNEHIWCVNKRHGDMPHALLGGVYNKFRTFYIIIKPHNQQHHKTRGWTVHPSTQNRNTAQGDNTQCVQHPQMQLSKMTANRPWQIASQHVEPATAEAATHMSLRCPHEDISILLEGALWLAIR